MYIQMIIERDTDFGRFLDTTRVLFSSLEYLFVSSKSYKFLTDFFLCNWCNKKRAVFHGEEDKLFNSSSMSSECIV